MKLGEKSGLTTILRTGGLIFLSTQAETTVTVTAIAAVDRTGVIRLIQFALAVTAVRLAVRLAGVDILAHLADSISAGIVETVLFTEEGILTRLALEVSACILTTIFRTIFWTLIACWSLALSITTTTTAIERAGYVVLRPRTDLVTAGRAVNGARGETLTASFGHADAHPVSAAAAVRFAGPLGLTTPLEQADSIATLAAILTTVLTGFAAVEVAVAIAAVTAILGTE